MTERREEPGPDDPAGDAAIEWVVRLRAGPLSAVERAAFDRWLAEDAKNAAAFEDVMRMYGHLAGMSPVRTRRAASGPRRRLASAAAAAALAATVALALCFDALTLRLRADHLAGVGERKSVALSDGSRVELDSGAAIAVRYSGAERRLVLLSGEAWFEVTPDPRRPFIVEAADGTVTALGTAFDVALDTAGARVTVTEHRVSVSSGGAAITVEEGQQSGFERDLVARAPERVDVGAATAWRRGKLIVSGKPLGEVLATIGRYRRGYVYCLDPSICASRVSGVFGSDDPLRSLQEIEASLGLRAIRLTNYMILLY